MCLRRAERDQALIEKQELKEAIRDYKVKEVELHDQLHFLQQRLHLLEEEVLRDLAKLHLPTAEDEALFWKDRYIKLAWLANQAMADIPLETPAKKDETGYTTISLQNSGQNKTNGDGHGEPQAT
ncbi:hypothetical protein CR513_29648, partial [Mucuna pruriens]